MVVFAYQYIDPLLDKGESAKAPNDMAGWGAPVDRLYQDLGDRTSFDQLIQDIDAYQATSQDTVQLIIQRLRDLGDSVVDVGDRLHHLEQRNVDLVILENAEDGDIIKDTTVAQGTTIAQHLQIIHRLQSEQRQRNLQRGHAKNRLKLKPPPGKAPYGYRRGKDRYILDRSTAPVVKDFFDNFLLYGSLRRSVRYLARKYNKRISVSTGKRWLTNPSYRGHLAYKTGDVITHTHTPIITEDEAAQVDRLLRRNSQLPRRSASAERSLAGLVQCAQCQSSMTITRVTKRSIKQRPLKKGQKTEYLYLRPTHCTRSCTSNSEPSEQHSSNKNDHGLEGGSTTKMSKIQNLKSKIHPANTTEGRSTAKTSKSCPGLPYNQVLDQTIDQICDTLPKIMATAPLPDVAGFKQRIEAQIQAKQQIIDQLPALGTSGVLDQHTIDLRTYNLRTEIADLQASLAQLPPVNFKETVQTVSLRQFWLDLSESERRFYFREFIHHIEIVRSPSDFSQWHTKLVLLLEMSR